MSTAFGDSGDKDKHSKANLLSTFTQSSKSDAKSMEHLLLATSQMRTSRTFDKQINHSLSDYSPKNRD